MTTITAPRARVAHTVARTETFASVVTGQPVEAVITVCGQEIIGGKPATAKATPCTSCAK